MNQEQLIEAINKDQGLSEDAKTRLLRKCTHPGFVESLFAGSVGAAVGNAIAIFLSLNRTAQIAISTAGFGIGQIVLDLSNKRKDNQTLKLNEKTRQYEIK